MSTPRQTSRARDLKRPADLFDRDGEWRALARFATDPAQTGAMGIVYGRRRQGKSWLLERLAGAVGGFYWEAFEASPRQQLGAFARALAAHLGAPFTPSFPDWQAAIAAWQATELPLVVLDELQYLVASSPELPSLLQGTASRRVGPRLILCGSALGAMRALLATDAPLRGRASLELVVRPFDYRSSAEYWGLARRPRDAVRLHALVGGTPAYRDLAGRRAPKAGAFEAWMLDVFLDPSGALFREGRILATDAALTDRSLYHGLLGAIAGGATRRGQIAGVVGRPDNTLAHPLDVLVDLALVERIGDPLHARRSFFRLAEPLVRAHHLLIAPNEGIIERRGARSIEAALTRTLASGIEGAHFESLARDWAARFASPGTLGGEARAIGPSAVSDASAKKELEIDLAVTSSDRVIALGEAKWAKSVGLDVLAALEHRRKLLGDRARSAKLILFSGGTFERSVRDAAARRDDLELVDPSRLYAGE